MLLTVIIPTWKRSKLLFGALESLSKQTRTPDEVIVILREEDKEASLVIKHFLEKLPLKSILVNRPGVIHAENVGIQKSGGDIICFLDDDAEAPHHWLEHIEKHFKDDPTLAGLGGPDLIMLDGDYRRNVSTVGKLTWYGKTIGNHHHKSIGIREVDVLKGVNMSFRREYVSMLDEALHSEHSFGNGSQWELDLCMKAKESGGKLIFDPALDLKHFSNHSHIIEIENVKNNAHNFVYVILKNFSPEKRIIFLFYIFLVGDSQVIGLMKLFQMIIKNQKSPFLIYWASLRGAIAGIKTFKGTREVPS